MGNREAKRFRKFLRKEMGSTEADYEQFIFECTLRERFILACRLIFKGSIKKKRS